MLKGRHLKQKRLHYKSTTVLSLLVAPLDGLEPINFPMGEKIDLPIKTTPMGIKENELSSVTRNLIPNIRVYLKSLI